MPASIANSCSPDGPPGAGGGAGVCDPAFRSTVAVGRGRGVGAAAAVGFCIAAGLSVGAGAGEAAGSPAAAVSGFSVFTEAESAPCCPGAAGCGSLPQAAKRTAATNTVRPMKNVRPRNHPNRLFLPSRVAIVFLLTSTCKVPAITTVGAQEFTLPKALNPSGCST